MSDTHEETDVVQVEATPAGAEVQPEAEKAAAPAKTPGVAPATKKPLGTKEVIPFEWKLIGESEGMILTLFKAVDRAEVEAQMERVQREGYYTNLRILEADVPLKQPHPVEIPAKSAKPVNKSARAARPKRAAAKQGTAKSAAPKRSTKASRPSKSKGARKRAKKKPIAKKKKTAKKRYASAAAKKKTAKKKKKR